MYGIYMMLYESAVHKLKYVLAVCGYHNKVECLHIFEVLQDGQY